MVQSTVEYTLAQAVERYLDPSVIPNREDWLVLRKHSRANVRKWLRRLPDMNDDQIRQEFWDVEGSLTYRKGVLSVETINFRYQVDPETGNIIGYEEILPKPQD